MTFSAAPVSSPLFRNSSNDLGVHWDLTVLDRLQSPLTHYHE